MSQSKAKYFNFKPYMQWIAAFAAFMLKFQLGINIGWNSPNIAKLTGENSTIPITPDEASWLLALPGLCGFVAIIALAASIEFFGSKNTILLTLAIFSAGHICLICASAVELLYAARALSGFAIAFTNSCYPIFIAEIATPKIRGTLISLSAAGYSFGCVFGLTLETYVQKNITGSTYLVICIATALLFVWLENTPYYFIKKDDCKSAKRSIDFYYGEDKEGKIYDDVKKYIDAQAEYTFMNKLRDFRLPVIRKSMILLAIIATMSCLSGLVIMTGYTENILMSAKSTLVNPQEFVIYTNVINAVWTLSTIKLVDVLGRRILLSLSSVGTTVAMLVLGTYFYLLKENYDLKNIDWLPLFAIILYTLAVFVGFKLVPGTLLSELFPEHLKSVAVLVMSLSDSCSAFIITKTYQPIADSLGHMYAFWMYAVFASLAIPCALFLMPETKGKSLQQIQESLNKK